MNYKIMGKYQDMQCVQRTMILYLCAFIAVLWCFLEKKSFQLSWTFFQTFNSFQTHLPQLNTVVYPQLLKLPDFLRKFLFSWNFEKLGFHCINCITLTLAKKRVAQIYLLLSTDKEGTQLRIRRITSTLLMTLFPSV